MEAQLGPQFPEYLASLERPRAVALRFNPQKGEGPALPFVKAPVPWEKAGYYYDPEARPGLHPFHDAGVYYLQEASAMAPAVLLDPKPGERILDLCAAPGGKTTQIAGKMGGRGLLVCNEIHPKRAKILSQNVERMGIANALVLNEAPAALAQRFPGFFDRILVDAPCSGEGMFRKEAAAVADWTPELVEMCARRQGEILDAAAKMLRPGGRLVYSTCTFAPQEDEEAVEAFLENHPEFLPEPVEAPWFQESGPAMYRIGMQVRDRALCDLGAYLFRTQGEGPAETLLMHACRNVLLRGRLENEKGVPPFRRQGYLNAQELMVARMAEDDESGLALAVHGGHNGLIGGHPDVGDIMLFAHGQPILVDAGCFDETWMHSLPVIGASQQAGGAMRRAEDVNCRLEEGYAMLSMNLMGVYPPEAHVSAWQRTAIYNREDGTVQLIDVFDLSAFETVRFHFITPCKPVLGERFAQLGPVRLRWEEGLTAVSEELKITGDQWTRLWGDTLYRLVLTTAEPVNGGQYTFNLNALRTFGG